MLSKYTKNLIISSVQMEIDETSGTSIEIIHSDSSYKSFTNIE